MTQEKTKAQKTFKVLGIIGNVLIWIFVAFSILTTIFVIAAQNDKNGVPQMFGKSIITVQTDSMEPTYEVGDMLFMERLSEDEKKELEEGDIITFRSPVDIDGDGKVGDINTHRIYSHDKKTGFIMTKGDNPAATIDIQPISYNEILGKCTEKGRIGGLGGVMDFLRSSLGFFLCIVLPMLLFFLYELYNFISLLVARKAAANPAPVSKEAEEEIKRKAIEEYLAQQQSTQGTEAPIVETPTSAEEQNKEENKDA